MSFYFHIVSTEYPPIHGGLETWTQQLAEHLAATKGIVTVYICDSHEKPSIFPGAVELVRLGTERAQWEEPLIASTQIDKLSAERIRLDYLLLRNAVRSRVEAHPRQSHVIISNFALRVGFVATLVADHLQVPHVAVVVGTDYSRGFLNAGERSLLREVCERARVVVCKSGEQRGGLAAEMPSGRFVVIPTSVECPSERHRIKTNPGTVRLIADCGLSYHKGSQILLESFKELLREQLPVELTVCGTTRPDQETYWANAVRETHRAAGGSFRYLGFVPRRTVQNYILNSSIYCSATLGEGSSAGRISALCTGIPIVTTECGEFVFEVEARSASHISVVPTACRISFRDALRTMAHKLLKNAITVDPGLVSMWRERFSPAQEWSTWENLFEALT